jgi:hypothetical protein
LSLVVPTERWFNEILRQPDFRLAQMGPLGGRIMSSRRGRVYPLDSVRWGDDDLEHRDRVVVLGSPAAKLGPRFTPFARAVASPRSHSKWARSEMIAAP